MPRRTKKRKPLAERRPLAPSRFKVRDCVRVKPGARHAEHPDVPLGGWAGTILEVDRRGRCCVWWSRETLAKIHPIYKKRCAIDGTVLDEYWIGEEDLVSDPGGPLAIERPTAITPRRLSADKQGDRVRMVLGLTSDDFLPEPNDDSLETYYDYLEQHLSLPADARYVEDTEDLSGRPPWRTVKVVALDREIAWNGHEGILCEVFGARGEDVVPLADLRLRRSDPNHQLVDDYAAWFFGDLSEDVDHFADDEADTDDEPPEEDEAAAEDLADVTWHDVAMGLLDIVAFTASYGAVLGAAFATMPWTRWAACIGGAVWGVVEAVARTAPAYEDPSTITPRLRKRVEVVFGLISGSIHGVLFGVLAVALIGTMLGAIAGFVLRRLFRAKDWLILRVFPRGLLFAAACGATAQAFYVDHIAASGGLWRGAGAGLAIGLLICLVCLPLSNRMVKSGCSGSP